LDASSALRELRQMTKNGGTRKRFRFIDKSSDQKNLKKKNVAFVLAASGGEEDNLGDTEKTPTLIYF